MNYACFKTMRTVRDLFELTRHQASFIQSTEWQKNDRSVERSFDYKGI
jgi:hypothetical protein